MCHCGITGVQPVQLPRTCWVLAGDVSICNSSYTINCPVKFQALTVSYQENRNMISPEACATH
jgi:hypothetical protein